MKNKKHKQSVLSQMRKNRKLKESGLGNEKTIDDLKLAAFHGYGSPHSWFKS